MPTFDGDNLLIILDSGVAGLSTVDAQETLYEPWKNWLLSNPKNRGYPFAFRTTGGDDLTPGINAGSYFFLRNDYGWRIKFPEEDIEVTLIGNLAPQDSSLQVFTPSDGSFKNVVLGLQPITQNVASLLTQGQLSQYRGKVSIDTVNGQSGIAYPIGTEFMPVSNITDAYTIMDTLGFNEADVRGSIALTRATGSTVWNGIGLATTVDFNGQNCSLALFKQMSVLGNMVSDGTTVLRDTLLNGTIAGLSGVVENSALNGTIQPSNSSTVYFFNCFSAVAGSGSPIIDANGQSGLDIVFRGYNGGIRVSNFTVGDSTMTLGLNTGYVNVDVSCTNFGDLQIRGIGFINNESALSEGIRPTDQINRSAFLDGSDIALIRGLTAGNATVSLDDLTLTIWDRDATHVLATYAISADGRTRTRTA